MRIEPIATFKMRKARAKSYGILKLGREFNVTSSGLWVFEVILRWKHGTRRGWYEPLDTHILLSGGWGNRHRYLNKIPTKYLYREINNAIADVLVSERLIPFEFDLDGNKRYEGLRYIGIGSDIKTAMRNEAQRIKGVIDGSTQVR